jgi:molybdate transport system substrate-binding protein
MDTEGVEVRAGVPKPDISSVEAFKRAMLNAKSIAYLRIAGVPELMEGLGIAEVIKAKVTIPDTDRVSELVAEGKIEVGIAVVTQILTTSGVELVGPLPPQVQIYIQFVAGVTCEVESGRCGAGSNRVHQQPSGLCSHQIPGHGAFSSQQYPVKLYAL